MDANTSAGAADGRRPRRPGRRAASGLPSQSIVVDGQERTFLFNPIPGGPRPTVIALHGGGGQAPGMVGLTRLVGRGVQAGFATVFPNGLHRAWNDGRTGTRVAARAGVDDARFLVALIDHLARQGVTDPGAVFVCGMSNGAFMSDHLARVAPDRVAGIGLVAGTAQVGAPTRWPAPLAPMPVMMFCGDADPLVPYRGGSVGEGLPGAARRTARRTPRAGRRGRDLGEGLAGRGTCMGAEDLAADWARIAGCDPRPLVERLPQPPGGLGVVRLTWMGPSGVPVVLHRIEGGGHTWPGGPQYLPPRLIGPVAAGLDATGILLGYFQWVLGRRGPGAPTPRLDAGAQPDPAGGPLS